jgi:hypothetical protein
MNNEKQSSGGFLLNIFNARNIVFVAMLAVGGLCIFMSASNTTGYLELTGMVRSLALMTGIALVIFSSTSATAAQLFFGHKGWAKIFAIPFIVIGIAVITFSIFSTLSLNYYRFVNSDAMQAEIRARQEQARAEIASQLQTESQDITQWTMDAIGRLLALSEDMQVSWARSIELIIDAADGMETQGIHEQVIEAVHVEVIPTSFFAFLLQLPELEPRYFFDFFMIATPAVFYDIIAPLAITIVLFLLGFNKKEQPIHAVLPEPVKPEPQVLKEKEPEAKPDINEIIIYIENALQDDHSLLSDDAIRNIEEAQCKKMRKYLMTFFYKNNPIIIEKDDGFFSIFDKKNLKRFIELQYNVERKEESA